MILKEDSENIDFTLYQEVASGTIEIEDEEPETISISYLQQKYNVDYKTAQMVMTNLVWLKAVDCVKTYYVVSNERLNKLCDLLFYGICEKEKPTKKKK